MSKKDEIKNKHHYVARKHLRYWSKDKISILNKPITSKKPFLHGIKGVARGDRFYKIQELENEDIEFIEYIINKNEDIRARKINLDFLNEIILVLNQAQRLPQKKLEALLCNYLEDTYGLIERDFFKIQEALLEEDLSSLSNEDDRLKIFIMIAHQTHKTKPVKDLIEERLSKEKGEENERISSLFIRNMWLISFIISNSLALSLFFEKAPITLLRNKTDEPFITSDAAALNVHETAGQSSADTPPTGYTAFFPISPEYALLVDTDKGAGGFIVDITIKEAFTYNKKIKDRIHYYLFATNEHQLTK